MKYAAFLRGINVGGKNKIKMETLREICFRELGLLNVKTYINSGNVVFETAKKDDKKLARLIEKAIEREFSLSIRVMVRSSAEIERIIGDNPFEGQFENEKELHVFFLDDEMPAEKREMLLAAGGENERYFVRGREIYCHLRVGVLDSLMGKDYIGKKLKIPATARNWRTIRKIAELL